MKASKEINILVIGQSNAISYNLGLSNPPLSESIQQWDITTQRFKTMQQGFISTYANGGGFENTYPACFRFAELLQEHTSERINVLLLAENGTSITGWQSGGSSYAAMKTQLQNAKIDKINYIIWQQGEADSAMPNATYYSNLANTFNSLRAEAFCNTSTPIIIGLLPCDFNLGYLNVAAGQIKISQFENNNILLADSIGLNHIGDTVHFDANSQKILGERMFNSLFREPIIKRTTTQRDDMGFAGNNVIQSVKVWNTTIGKYEYHDGVNWVTI